MGNKIPVYGECAFCGHFINTVKVDRQRKQSDEKTCVHSREFPLGVILRIRLFLTARLRARLKSRFLEFVSQFPELKIKKRLVSSFSCRFLHWVSIVGAALVENRKSTRYTFLKAASTSTCMAKRCAVRLCVPLRTLEVTCFSVTSWMLLWSRASGICFNVSWFFP